MSAQSTLPPPALHDALDDLSLEFSAGALCLDFANTVDWHASAQPVEFLPSYTHLVAWARQHDLLDAESAEARVTRAMERPAEAEDVRRRAVALREAIYRIFSARHRGKAENPADLQTINRELRVAFDHLSVSKAPYSWEWRDTGDALDAMLWPIARSMAELLTSPEIERVRECAGDPCGWLFLDTSRNRSRRWCSMESCGNRAKARRHYERTRATRTSA